MNRLETERRILQIVIAVSCTVPLTVGGIGIVEGASWLRGVGNTPPIDLDSHFRYLSGIFLALGVGFASCIPKVEIRMPRIRLLSFMVMAGGLARAWSLMNVGVPSQGHIWGLCMELGVVPVLMLWQARLARRYAEAAG